VGTVGISLVLKNLKDFRGHWLETSFGAVSSIYIYVSQFREQIKYLLLYISTKKLIMCSYHTNIFFNGQI